MESVRLVLISLSQALHARLEEGLNLGTFKVLPGQLAAVLCSLPYSD